MAYKSLSARGVPWPGMYGQSPSIRRRLELGFSTSVCVCVRWGATCVHECVVRAEVAGRQRDPVKNVLEDYDGIRKGLARRIVKRGGAEEKKTIIGPWVGGSVVDAVRLPNHKIPGFPRPHNGLKIVPALGAIPVIHVQRPIVVVVIS